MVELPSGAKCLHCGYDLRGLPQNICPECGKGFDPTNPFTYLHPDFGTRRRTRALRRCLTPPLLDCAIVLIVAFYVVVVTSRAVVTPVKGFEPLWLIAVGCAGCRAWWRRVTRVRMLEAAGLQPPIAGRRRAQVLLWSGAVVVVTFIYPWHTLLRFHFSFPEFQAVARKAESRLDASWVGLFRVKIVRAYPNGTVFFATGRNTGSYYFESGIVYAPQSGEIRGKPYHLHRPLAPDWWTASFR